VLLPENVEMDGVQSPIKADPEWRKTSLNDQQLEHETDTFDTFMESSWYYARFTCPDFEQGILDPEKANYWLPVDQYVGGIEHAILHLLYARFYHKLLRDEGFVECNEPFKRLLCQGMVLADSFFKENEDGSKTWYNPNDVEVDRDEKGRIVAARDPEHQTPLQSGGMTKMSKSKNNGVDPQTAIDQYGADTVRLFTMFAAPPEQTLEWNDDGVAGGQRFLRRLWSFCADNAQWIDKSLLNDQHHISNKDDFDKTSEECRHTLHITLEKALTDFSKNQFNTVIAACMTLLNALTKDSIQASVKTEGVSMLLRLLSPIAPHICHTLWKELNFGDDILTANWPSVDQSALTKSSIEIVIQVNGKVRAKMEASHDSDKATLEKQAMAQDNVQKFIDGKTVRKVIVVPSKLVNIVAN
jgi:leucyl-tRNA synthetase